MIDLIWREVQTPTGQIGPLSCAYACVMSGIGHAMLVHNADTTNGVMQLAAWFTYQHDLKFGTIGRGPIIRSPDGTSYRIVVADGGVLSTTLA